jgi:hypothetical protein
MFPALRGGIVMAKLNVARALAAGIVLVAVSGIAVAADGAAKSSGYTACANSKHQLAVSKHGKCAKHFHKVSVGARGPAGARGPSDVYVASGNLAVAAPTYRARPTLAPVTSLSLTLPAGLYLLQWQVLFSGEKVVSGNATTAPYTMTLECSPVSSGGGFGQRDLVNSTLSSDEFDAGAVTTRFEFLRQLSDFWAVTIPAGGAHITMDCDPPMLVGPTGTSTTVDSTSLSGQIEATRTTNVHGSDNGVV